ncbi:hypothetical protein [Marilutibacter alkalisoli]|nr:hypothetical protein [Lysobacter alkalisoli]
MPYITPPPKNSCNAVAMVLMVVVAIVVSVVTYGAATGYFGAYFGATGTAIAAGATAGAAGAAASSAVGSATGVTSFSWQGVAAGGITGAITGGLASQFGTVGGALSGAPQWGKAAALAVANAGANYAGQKLAGMDVSFSWNSIAASAVSSLGAAKIAPMVAGKLDLKTDFANDFAYGMTGGMVSAAVRSSFGQTLHRSDYGTVVMDGFSNALGNAIGRDTDRWLASRAGAGTAAMGGVNGGVSTAYASGDFGPDPVVTGNGPATGGTAAADRRRSNAIGPILAETYDPNVPTLHSVVVTADRAQNQWYMDMWSWSRRYRQPGPPTSGNRADQVRYWSDSHQRLAPAHQQWIAGSYPAGSLNRTSGPSTNPYLARYNAINGALERMAAPVMKVRAWADGKLGFIEQKVQGWGDFNTDLSTHAGDYASSAAGAGGYAALGAANRTVADIVQGGIGLGRLFTNTDRLASTLDAVGTVLSQRPSDTVAQAVDAWNGMTPLEKKQAGVTALAGLAAGTSRLGRAGGVDRSVSTAYARSVADRLPASSMNSSSLGWGIEKASPELIANVSSRRQVVFAKPGSSDMAYLDWMQAEANVGGKSFTHILLRENPSKAAVLEEFLHGTQARIGVVDRLGTSGFGSAETHVKDFMIRHQSMLGLSSEDVVILKQLRDAGL